MKNPGDPKKCSLHKRGDPTQFELRSLHKSFFGFPPKREHQAEHDVVALISILSQYDREDVVDYINRNAFSLTSVGGAVDAASDDESDDADNGRYQLLSGHITYNGRCTCLNLE